MVMNAKGLVKTNEELAELAEVMLEAALTTVRLSVTVGKKLAYLATDAHPDGKGSLRRRLEEEIGDVKAILLFVEKKLELDQGAIAERTLYKLQRYTRWDAEPSALAQPEPSIRPLASLGEECP